MDYSFSIKGLDELKKAIQRNPEVVKNAVGIFLKKGMEIYNRVIMNNPWRIGMSGGGVPVATGNLRDTHRLEYKTWEAVIYPTASYAEGVHKTRPWLEYAFDKGGKEVELLEGEMMDTILKNLIS